MLAGLSIATLSPALQTLADATNDFGLADQSTASGAIWHGLDVWKELKGGAHLEIAPYMWSVKTATPAARYVDTYPTLVRRSPLSDDQARTISVADANHPLAAGVGAISFSDATYFPDQGGDKVAQGSTVIASWSDGAPALVVRDLTVPTPRAPRTTMRLATLNSQPFDTQDPTVDGKTEQGDVPGLSRLIWNTVNWSVRGDVLSMGWLSKTRTKTNTYINLVGSRMATPS